MAFVLLTILVIILFFLYRKNKNEFLINDLIWLLVPWTVMVIFYLYGGIEYESKLDIYSGLYLILSLLVFLLFRKIGMKLKIKNSSTKGDSIKIDTYPLFLVSFISGISLLLYLLSKNNIIFGYTRNINTDMFGTLLHFFSCAALIVWLYDFSFALRNGTKIKLYSYISILVYCIQPLLISGRESIVILIFLTLIIFVYYKGYKNIKNNSSIDDIEINRIRKRKKLYKRLKYIGVFVSCIIIYYFLFLSNNRYGNSMISLFEWSSNCKFSEQLLNFTSKIGTFGVLVLNIIYYYSSQLSKFAFIFKYYKGPYLYGLFQCNIISRRLPESWHLSYTEVTTAANNLMKSKGFYGLHSIWDTGIGYFIYDFGRIGAMFEIAVFGIVVGIIVKKFQKNQSIINLLYLDFICVGLFIISMYSPIFSYGWLFPLIWLCIFDKFYTKQKNI